MARRPAQAARHRRPLVVTALVAAVAAAVLWVVFWQQSAPSALVRVPVLDEAWYLQEAARLTAAGGPGDQPFTMSAGYPALVALTGAPTPTDDGVLPAPPVGLVLLQALLWFGCGLLVAAAVWTAGRRAGASPPAALVAAVAAALLLWLHRPALIYARTVLLEVPLMALVAAALALVTLPRRRVGAALAGAGLGLGLAVILRAHVIALWPLLLLVAWRRRPHSRPTTATLVLATVLALLPAALASWHNSTQLGRLAGPSLNGGLNLFLGQTSTDGFFPVLPGLDLQDDPAGRDFLAARLGQEVPDAGAADRAWWAAAVARAREEPLAAAGGWVLKIWRHLQDVPVAQVTPLAFWPAEAPVLRGLVVPWGLLVVAALAGMVAALAARRPPAHRDHPAAAAGTPAGTAPAAARDLAARLLPWLLAAGLLVAVQSLFFVVTRYRLVLVPLLAVAAGLGGLAAWSLLRQRAGARLGVVAGAVLATVLLVQPWGLAAEQARRQGLEGANLARRLLVLAEATPAPSEEAGPHQDDRPPLRRRAETLLADATAVAPGQTDLWRLRVVNLHRLGRTQQALGVLTRGTMRAADPRPLALLRVGLLRTLGRLDEAEAQLQAELRATPDDPDLLHDLAVLRGQRGRWRAAAAAARRLQAAAPADARGWLDLAVAQARLGDRTAAVRTLRAGMGRVTDDQGRALLAENLRRLAAGSAAPPDTARSAPPPPPR